jgi:hypothetical protein
MHRPRLLCGLLLVAVTARCLADEKPGERASLEDDRELLGTAFNWVQDPPAPKPGGIVLNFAGGHIFLEHAVDDGKGKLDVRRLGRVPFELKEVGKKRVIALKEKNDKLSDITYTLENDRLIIEDGECRLHGRTSLKGKWQRWLGDYAVSGTPYWPCPSAMISDQLSSRPLAMFCAHQLPGGKAKYAFLIVFKIPEGFSTSGYVPMSTFATTPEQIYYGHSFEVKGRKFEIGYKVVRDAKTGAPVSDSLTLGGAAIKAGEPRCYVVDMTAEKTVYRPVRAELPRVTLELPKQGPDEPKDWYRPGPQWVTPVMKDIEELKKKSQELQALLKAVPKK